MASLVRALWAFFHLPECKVRSYEELDITNAKILKARQFSEYEIDHQEMMHKSLKHLYLRKRARESILLCAKL